MNRAVLATAIALTALVAVSAGIAKADTEFQPGDVVKLKSGGPKMTVRHHVNNAAGQYLGVQTRWFKSNDETEVGIFLPLSLKKIERRTRERR